jgi:hypothetical protein
MASSQTENKVEGLGAGDPTLPLLTFQKSSQNPSHEHDYVMVDGDANSSREEVRMMNIHQQTLGVFYITLRDIYVQKISFCDPKHAYTLVFRSILVDVGSHI